LISSAVAHFLAECHQKNGKAELNQVMSKIVDSIQGMIKQLRAFSEERDQARIEKLEAEAKPGRAMNLFIEKLNAQNAVMKARKDLQEAEARLKTLRKGK
jgi:hypothetical protein